MEGIETQAPSEKQLYADAVLIGSKNKDAVWYDKTLPGVPEDAREVLENYSHVPPNEVDAHVLAIRDKAWEIYPWPCVGKFKFIHLSLCKMPSYASMVEGLKKGARYLDIGFCLGQDVRKLIADGAPGDNIYGIELNGPFIDLGYDLFRDRETLKAQLMQGDALDASEDSVFAKLAGTVDYIHLGFIMHVFDLEQQQLLLENCLRALKPEAGALIVGDAVGDVEGVLSPANGFWHSEDTFKKLWKGISEKTGQRYDCRATLGRSFGVPGFERAQQLTFEVEILGHE
ncbi:uncharacterized protein GGS22DRAFT_152199 [Annulohypoxylon maeteangense]|uniref:uncharacterized protein n=1 Tax=Annulohypoxylon maeteangense TaxID=1927788 RepID=UPI002008E784|nr:uncharacterized protein GGS22DRAFT_152199 [Annulohypoxylon maeteangense]KAI0888707.1 hypothetical protein GGS22DRAFT_152199 [Annulohypoxylon maeteangense]